ncbi:MAG TPA: hypothetical protein VF491_23140 [Vicinamibacterales bacterium]
MDKRWSTLTAVITGVVLWGIGWMVIDLTVLQIYPLPADLPKTATTAELLATRPDAAVALNVFGDLLVLAAVAYWVAGKANAQAGIIVTIVVFLLGIAQSVALSNFRWMHGVGYVASLVAGWFAAKAGARR